MLASIGSIRPGAGRPAVARRPPGGAPPPGRRAPSGARSVGLPPPTLEPVAIDTRALPPARRAGPADGPAVPRPDAARSLSLGFALMLGAFALFVVMDTSAKWLVTGGLAALQVAFMRFAVHLALVALVYGPREGASLARSRRPGAQLARGAMLSGATLLNFTALKYLPLPVTISIFFAGPLVVCLLSVPVLGERVGPRRFAAVGTGFLGVLVILQPWSERFDWHVVYSLGAMLCASSYFVMSRLIRGSDGNGTTQLYGALAGTVALAPFALEAWVWPDGALQWALLGLLGTLGLTGHSMVVRAHEFAEASVLAPTVYSQILYVSLASWLVFGQAPTGSTLLGSGIVIASGLYVWWRERSLAGRGP